MIARLFILFNVLMNASHERNTGKLGNETICMYLFLASLPWRLEKQGIWSGKEAEGL
ncbi:MAG: hypothetical protein MJE68_04350 [Proteobacteria bacterium]|nr:hypothetical protein [Pseudomonadota bacterium]